MQISIDVNLTRRNLEVIVVALQSHLADYPDDTEVRKLHEWMHAICENNPTLNPGKKHT